jgi:hypothetical protein
MTTDKPGRFDSSASNHGPSARAARRPGPATNAFNGHDAMNLLTIPGALGGFLRTFITGLRLAAKTNPTRGL